MLKSIEFLRGKSRGRVIGGTKLASSAPVILGLVPRILWKRVSNLVNKFALLLHKCWSSMLSAFCMLFKYPSPDAKASPSPARGEGMHCHWCHKILGTGPRMTGGRGANYFGRSMIEMLGVLAIVGVLTVGGIAGYSKAMEKFKMNQLIEEYRNVVFTLLEYQKDIRESVDMTGAKTIDLLDKLNAIPQKWEKHSETLLKDSMGYYVIPWSVAEDEGDGRYWDIMYEILLMSKNDNGLSYDASGCEKIIMNFGKPLNNLWRYFYFGDGRISHKPYYGKDRCKEGVKCFSDITWNDARDICKLCDGQGPYCALVFAF